MASPEIGVRLIPGNKGEFRKAIQSSLRNIQFGLSDQAISKQKLKVEKKIRPVLDVRIRSGKLRGEINKALKDRFTINLKANLDQIRSARTQIQNNLGKFKLDFKGTGLDKFQRRIDSLNKKLGQIKFTQSNAREFLKRSNAFFAANPVKIRTEYILPSKRSISSGGGSRGGGGGVSAGGVSPEGGSSKNFEQNQKAVNDKIKEFNKLTRTASRETFTFAERLGFTSARLAAYLIPASAFFQLTRSIGFARDAIIDINRDINRLTQVFNGSADRANQVARDILETAKAYGQSGRELLNVSVLLAQSGEKFRSNDAILAVVESLAQSQLAATFGDINNVLEGTIAVLNQFSLAGTEAGRVLDVANLLSKNFAFEAENLFTAVKTGGAAFSAAGGDFDEFAASIAAIRDVTRLSASTIGTSLNTISLRLIRPDVVEFLETFKGGLDIRDEAGQLKGVADILVEIANASKDLSTDEIGKLVQEVSGIRQGKVLVPLLQDIQQGDDSKFLRALKLQELAPGSLARDAAIGADRIDVQLGRISASFEKLFSEIGESPEFKNLIKDVTSLASEFADVSREVSGLIPLLIKLGGIQLAISAVKGVSSFLRGTRNNNPGPFDPGSVAGVSPGFGGGINIRGGGISGINSAFNRGRTAFLKTSSGQFQQAIINTANGDIVRRNLDPRRLTSAAAIRLRDNLNRRDSISTRFGRINALSEARRNRANESQVGLRLQRSSLLKKQGALGLLESRREALRNSTRSVQSVLQSLRDRGVPTGGQGLALAKQRVNTLERVERAAKRQVEEGLRRQRITGKPRSGRETVARNLRIAEGAREEAAVLKKNLNQLAIANRAMESLTRQRRELQKEYERAVGDSKSAKNIQKDLDRVNKELASAKRKEAAASKALSARGRIGAFGAAIGSRFSAIGRGIGNFTKQNAPAAGALALPLFLTGITDSISSGFSKSIREITDPSTGLARSDAESIISRNRSNRVSSDATRGIGNFAGGGALIGFSVTGSPVGAGVGALAGGILGGGLALNRGSTVANRQVVDESAALASFNTGGLSERLDEFTQTLRTNLDTSPTILGAGSSITGNGLLSNIARSNQTLLDNVINRFATGAETLRNRVFGGGITNTRSTGIGRFLPDVSQANVEFKALEEAREQLLNSEGFKALTQQNRAQIPDDIQRILSDDNRFRGFFNRLSDDEIRNDPNLIVSAEEAAREIAFQIREEARSSLNTDDLEVINKAVGTTEDLVSAITSILEPQRRLVVQLGQSELSIIKFTNALQEQAQVSAQAALVGNIQNQRQRAFGANLFGAGNQQGVSAEEIALSFNRLSIGTRDAIRNDTNAVSFVSGQLANSRIGSSLTAEQQAIASDALVIRSALEEASNKANEAFFGTNPETALAAIDQQNDDVKSITRILSRQGRDLQTDEGRRLLSVATEEFNSALRSSAVSGELSRGGASQVLGGVQITQILQQLAEVARTTNNQEIERRNILRNNQELVQRQSTAAFDSIRNILIRSVGNNLNTGRITSGTAVRQLRGTIVESGDLASIAREFSDRQQRVTQAQRSLDGARTEQEQEIAQNRLNVASSELAITQNRLNRELQNSESNFRILSQAISILDNEINSLVQGFQSQGARNFGELGRDQFFFDSARQTFQNGLGGFNSINELVNAISNQGTRNDLVSQVENVPLPVLQRQIAALQSRAGLPGVGGLSGSETSEALLLLAGIANERRFGNTEGEQNLINQLRDREGALSERDDIERQQVIVQRELISSTDSLAQAFNSFVDELGLVIPNQNNQNRFGVPDRNENIFGRNQNNNQQQIPRRDPDPEPSIEEKPKKSPEPRISEEPAVRNIVVDNNANINITGFADAAAAAPAAAASIVTAVMQEFSNNLDASIPDQADVIRAIGDAVKFIKDELQNLGNPRELRDDGVI